MNLMPDWPWTMWLRWPAEAGFVAAGVALAVTDLRTGRLPDRIVLPALWAGLLLNTSGLFATPADAVLGAAAGYLSLWLLDAGHALCAGGRHGLGRGDLKLAAMVGGWVGLSGLASVLLIAFLAGTCAVLLGVLRRHRRIGESMPFGPALALGGVVVLLAGPSTIARLLGA